ncbi:MAG: hypothetical protein ACRD16_11560, partial [Thermoanaerobaculia bacterium]
MISLALLAVVIARSLMPAIGVLFLGWEPGRVLLILFLDTMLAIGMVIVALTYFFSRTTGGGSLGARAKALISAVVAAVFLVAFLSIPLGIPLIFMLADTGFSLRLTWADPQFQRAAEIQALITAAWGIPLIWQLRKKTPEELGLKPLFAMNFLRWLVLIFVTFTGLPRMLGAYGPH